MPKNVPPFRSHEQVLVRAVGQRRAACRCEQGSGQRQNSFSRRLDDSGHEANRQHCSLTPLAPTRRSARVYPHAHFLRCSTAFRR